MYGPPPFLKLGLSVMKVVEIAVIVDLYTYDSPGIADSAEPFRHRLSPPRTTACPSSEQAQGQEAVDGER